MAKDVAVDLGFCFGSHERRPKMRENNYSALTVNVNSASTGYRSGNGGDVNFIGLDNVRLFDIWTFGT